MADGGSEVAEKLSGIKHKVLVLSGKGGVGKSTVTVQMALGLVAAGYRVGVLDVDLCGPSIPKMFGIDSAAIHSSSQGWVPVFADAEQRLSVMSIAFLLSSKEDAVVWRGPKKSALIRQFLTDVMWGELDYLLVDTPPGTSDEHITVATLMAEAGIDGAVVVTTPQNVALSDVRKELTFCDKVGIKIIGLVENMSGFVCPHCADCTNVFGKGGGEALAAAREIPFLGCIPLDPLVMQAAEDGTVTAFIDAFPSSQTGAAIQAVVAPILALGGRGGGEGGGGEGGDVADMDAAATSPEATS